MKNFVFLILAVGVFFTSSCVQQPAVPGPGIEKVVSCEMTVTDLEPVLEPRIGCNGQMLTSNPKVVDWKKTERRVAGETTCSVTGEEILAAGYTFGVPRVWGLDDWFIFIIILLALLGVMAWQLYRIANNTENAQQAELPEEPDGDLPENRFALNEQAIRLFENNGHGHMNSNSDGSFEFTLNRSSTSQSSHTTIAEEKEETQE